MKMDSMAMGISTYNIGQDNDIAGAPQCANVCEQAETKISNIVWSSDNSVSDDTVEPEDEDEFGEWTIGETTESLSECWEEGCTECREGFYANYPEYSFATCVDTTVYKYGNICVENSKWNKSQCS